MGSNWYEYEPGKMIFFRAIILLLLGVLTGVASGVSYNCATPDRVRDVAGTCLLKGVVLVSHEDIANASFPDDVPSGSVRMVNGNVTLFTHALAVKLAKVKDLTIDEMGVRQCYIWPSLEHVSAQNNSITSVTFTTVGAGGFVEEIDYQLRTLHLHNNALTSVPDFGKHFKRLKVLVLDGNLLEHLSLDSFTHLTQLQTLSIARNRLINVASGTAGLMGVQLLQLKHLSLAGNRLLALNVSGWELESLVTLDLSGNDLYLLDVPKLDQFGALKEIQYAGNDWNCDWLSAMQLYLRGKKISVGDRDVEGRCDRDKMANLQGVCCYESALKDYSTDLFADRWEQLNELQRRYDLVKFAYNNVQEADLNVITDKALGLRGKLSDPVADAQDAIEGTLHRLRSAVANEGARMERLAANVERTLADLRQSLEELYKRSVRPKPTLNAVLQETIAGSLERIRKNIEQLRRRIQDYVYEINVREKHLRQLEARIASFEGLLVRLKEQNQVLHEQVESIEPRVNAAYQMIESSGPRLDYDVMNAAGNYRYRNRIAKYERRLGSPSF